jgi:hypothetical protein
MLLTHASHPDPFEANGMPPIYDSVHYKGHAPASQASRERNDLQIPDGLLTCCHGKKKRAGHPGALLELVNLSLFKLHDYLLTLLLFITKIL